jgi:hypothetical protein
MPTNRSADEFARGDRTGIVPFAWFTADETYLRSSPKNHLTRGFLDHIRGTGTQERRFKGLIVREGKHPERGGHSE